MVFQDLKLELCSDTTRGPVKDKIYHQGASLNFDRRGQILTDQNKAVCWHFWHLWFDDFHCQRCL